MREISLMFQNIFRDGIFLFGCLNFYLHLGLIYNASALAEVYNIISTNEDQDLTSWLFTRPQLIM